MCFVIHDVALFPGFVYIIIIIIIYTNNYEDTEIWRDKKNWVRLLTKNIVKFTPHIVLIKFVEGLMICAFYFVIPLILSKAFPHKNNYYFLIKEYLNLNFASSTG